MTYSRYPHGQKNFRDPISRSFQERVLLDVKSNSLIRVSRFERLNYINVLLGFESYSDGDAMRVREGDAWKFRLHAITPPPLYAPVAK